MRGTSTFCFMMINNNTISLYFEKNGKEIFKYIQEKGVIADWREPNVIRIAPVPLYNSFQDVYDFYEIIKSYNAG